MRGQNPLLHYFFPQFVGQSIGHHGLASAWGPIEQQHHASTVRDCIVQAHVLTTALEGLKVAHCVQNQTLLLLTQDNL